MAKESVTPATKSGPPSYFPDNDAYYPTFADGIEKPSAASPAGTLFSYFPPASFPWNQAGFIDYDEPPLMPQDAMLTAPKKYALQADSLPPAISAARPESALLIAHLPEHALLWVEGRRTLSTGRTRYFQSPRLPPGRKYGYTVRADWIEGGRWVSQTRMIPVQAGTIQAIYLRQ